MLMIFFFQAEDGIRDGHVTGVQTCALPIYVLPMTKRKIDTVIAQYADAARRAIKAGFDGVEVSAAQRLLIQTFFSKFSNERDDEYGSSSLENSSRFVLEVVIEIGRAHV